MSICTAWRLESLGLGDLQRGMKSDIGMVLSTGDMGLLS
jgi:hypothetical protein